MKIKSVLNKEELALFRKLNTPSKIQNFLNKMPINFNDKEDTLMSPRRMLKENKAHCMEGALFAAAVLWFHGYKPLLLDLVATEKDFDHVVTLFKKDGFWGALSKTNHAVLRYREPVYKNVRELAMSYFHEYFDDKGSKNLRTYSKPFSLSKYGLSWVTTGEDLWQMGIDLDDSPHQRILTRSKIASLRRADDIEIEAGKIVQYKK